MKRLITKILTVTACMAMMLAAVPATNINTVQAASKAEGTIDLKAKKLTIPKGKTQTIKNKTVTMVKARRYQIKAKFGTKTVSTKGTYKSSKPAVATVSSTGLVTAKAPGAATIAVTYKGVKQTFKIKVTASHKHAWKTTRKATCANTGKKLCQTCGVTGTTAKKTTHTWKTTKKATCQTAGKKTCMVCGTAKTVAKTGHNWESETWTEKVGLGKPIDIVAQFCSGCHADLTHLTRDERFRHIYEEGTSIAQSLGRDYNGYKIVKITETWCKTCGIPNGKMKTKVVEKGTGTLHDHYLGNQKGMFITNENTSKASKATVASVASVSMLSDEMPVEDIAVAEPESEIVVNSDEIAVDEIEAVVPADEVLVEDAENAEDVIISGNEAVTENNVSINQ